MIVRRLATRLAAANAQLYEDPFDLLAVIERNGVLAEVKTLDGREDDERARVREALSQLLYYEAFVTPPDAADVSLCKVACFERPIRPDHSDWLSGYGIAVIWQDGEVFAGNDLAADSLGQYIEELRRPPPEA